ncbi:MAG TPA: HPr family phosphocarrier protein, partial [Campylobacterales bacterium]|nr:HPr family phosphocarrier protein [Campylobacterales bacterium]
MINFISKLFKTQKPIKTILTITSSNGFHLRPIAKFVNEVKKFETSVSIEAKGESVTATQVPKILSLSLEKNETFTLVCIGQEAEETSLHLSSFFVKLMDDDKVEKEFIQEEYQDETPLYQSRHSIRHGTCIAKGIAVGVPTSYVIEQTYQKPETTFPLKEALSKTASDLNELYENNKEKEEAEIFLAHKALLDSDLFQKNFENIDEEIDKLKDGKFESRIADYKDIKKRIESYMGVNATFTLPNGNETPCIVVADDLLPSEVEELSKLNVTGVILQNASITSHASILLRSFNIPSMICKETLMLTGEEVHSILDASLGQFIDDPTEEDYKKAEERALLHRNREKESYLKRFDEVKTLNGKNIKVLANITDLNSAIEAKELGADGIGLLRTEFMFTKEKPSIEKQTKTYKEIFKIFHDITIRTLDIGGDKSLPYINMAKEDNPFLGIRGI